MAETQRKTQNDQARLQLDMKKSQDDMVKHVEDNKTKIAIENAKLTHQTIADIAFNQPTLEPTLGAEPPAAPSGLPQPKRSQKWQHLMQNKKAQWCVTTRAWPKA